MRSVMIRARRMILILISATLLSLSSQTQADTTAFIEQFIKNQIDQKYDNQVGLIEQNSARVSSAVKQLIDEAMTEDRVFEQRMRLLDYASSMAYMHSYWNGDKEPLKLVEPLINSELSKESKRVAKIMKWKKEERNLGNFVLKANPEKTKEAGLAPVLYPHWMHRIMFECKVCHNAIFQMKRWTNDITQEKIVAGKQCGVCHDGKMAFSAEEKCERCHMAGLPEAEKLHNPSKIDQMKLAKSALAIGAKWNPSKLPNGTMPLDKYKFIDWLKLKELNAFKPIPSLDKDTEYKTRDNVIRFVSKSSFLDDVLFGHKVHADWINCSSCHPALFSDTLGGTKIKMTEMSKGRFCGNCHGKVSFTFADCKRCHNTAKTVFVEGALERHPTKH